MSNELIVKYGLISGGLMEYAPGVTGFGTYSLVPKTFVSNIIIPIYHKSVWTSFFISNRNTSTTNFGSGSGAAVPILVPRKTRILNSRIEVTAIATNPTNCDFAIYNVESGEVTSMLFYQSFQVTATGLYTLTTNLDLDPGVYAYAITQDIILGYRTVTLSDNGFGCDPTMGTNFMINGKSYAGFTLSNPFGSTANYGSSVPVSIFEVQYIE
jgi:hypothetical protein